MLFKKNKGTKQAKTVAKKTAPKKKTTKGGVNDENKTFVFRRYKEAEGKKRVRHPKLIVETTEKTNKFMGLTSSPKKGHHSNIPLEKNPQKGKKGKAYIRKEIREKTKDNFDEILKDYKLSKKDKQKIIDYLEKNKKKK